MLDSPWVMRQFPIRPRDLAVLSFPRVAPLAAVERPAARALAVGLTALAIVTLVAGLRLVVSARPSIGGVDFHFYTLFARDLADGAPVSAARYRYFPGVYHFWKTVFLLSDGSMAALQWAYVGVLVANAGLVGTIVARVTRRGWSGLIAMAAYLVLSARLEGFEGGTEPIATLPFLAGMRLWIGLTERQRPTLGLLALAACLGLAVFVKQQGGLLAIGTLGLLPGLGTRPAAPEAGADATVRYTLVQLLAVPVVALVVFVAAMIADGGGLAAIASGVEFARTYPAHGSWLRHVTLIWTLSAPASHLFLAGAVIWVAALAGRRRHPEAWHLRMLVLGVALLSAAAGLAQFQRRGYLHYALLILPSAIVAIAVTGDVVLRWLRQSGRRLGPAPQVAAAALLGFLTISASGAGELVAQARRLVSGRVDRTPTAVLQQRYLPVCERVSAGQELLLVPLLQNIVHATCGTRSTSYIAGYGFGWWPEDLALYVATLDAPSVASVFVFADESGQHERRFFASNSRETLLQELTRRGFRESLAIEAGRLFQRPPDSPPAE